MADNAAYMHGIVKMIAEGAPAVVTDNPLSRHLEDAYYRETPDTRVKITETAGRVCGYLHSIGMPVVKTVSIRPWECFGKVLIECAAEGGRFGIMEAGDCLARFTMEDISASFARRGFPSESRWRNAVWGYRRLKRDSPGGILSASGCRVISGLVFKAVENDIREYGKEAGTAGDFVQLFTGSYPIYEIMFREGETLMRQVRGNSLEPGTLKHTHKSESYGRQSVTAVYEGGAALAFTCTDRGQSGIPELSVAVPPGYGA